MALIDLDSRHVTMEIKVLSKRWNFKLETVLRPEIDKWMSQNAVRYQLIHTFKTQISILDNQKAMLFKLTWM